LNEIKCAYQVPVTKEEAEFKAEPQDFARLMLRRGRMMHAIIGFVQANVKCI